MTNDNQKANEADDRRPRSATRVADLKGLVEEGETRVFKRTMEATGKEPAFYRVAVRGEVNALPLWLDRPPHGKKPNPGVSIVRPVPLSSVTSFRFQLDDTRDKMADLYRVGQVYLISKTLKDLLLRLDPDCMEVCPATVQTRDDPEVGDFVVCMSKRVIDAVDIEKTDVTVESREVYPGGGAICNSYPLQHRLRPRRDCCTAGRAFFRRETSGPMAVARGLDQGRGRRGRSRTPLCLSDGHAGATNNLPVNTDSGR